MQYDYAEKNNVFHAILECRKSVFLEKINGLTFHKIHDAISEKKCIYFENKNDNNTDTLISGTKLDI